MFLERSPIAAHFRLQYGIAASLQELANHPTQIGLIFGDQNCLFTRLSGFQGQLGRANLRGRRDARKIDAKGGSSSDVAAHTNVPAAGPDNVVQHRKAQTSSLILALRSKKWI